MEWTLPGEDRDQLGGAQTWPQDSPLLGWDVGVLAGEDPMDPAVGIWVQPQVPGEDSVELVWRSQRNPHRLSRRTHHTAALKSPCPASSSPATLKRASEQVVHTS